jgi:[ribosomal protein S5]-alanine N-acetyltransferase
MTPPRTPRLQFREPTTDDAAFVLELVNDPAWLRYIGDRNVHSLDDAAAYVRNGPAASFARHGFGLWRVALHDDTPIGLCGLLQRDALSDPDLGFAYLPAFRGQGYGLEAARAVLAHARHGLGARRVLAIVMPANRDSIRLLERLGMQPAGRVVLHADASGDDLYALDFQTKT